MKTHAQTLYLTRFQSTVLPAVETTNPRLAEAIAWADRHPPVWDTVTRKRSKAFGLDSCVYIGWAQGSKRPEAVLERVRQFHDLVMRPGKWGPANAMVTWRARFTFDHYQDKGFTGGFFQQHDARFPRSCLTLDYTPATFEQVLEKFRQWMDPYYDTVCITLDDRPVWTAAACP